MSLLTQEKILNKLGSLSSGHQACFIHMTGDLCLCWGVGNDEASSLSLPLQERFL